MMRRENLIIERRERMLEFAQDRDVVPGQRGA